MDRMVTICTHLSPKVSVEPFLIFSEAADKALLIVHSLTANKVNCSISICSVPLLH